MKYVKCIILIINVSSINPTFTLAATELEGSTVVKPTFTAAATELEGSTVVHQRNCNNAERIEERWCLKIPSQGKQSDQDLHYHDFCIFWNH